MRWCSWLYLCWLFPHLFAQHDMYLLKLVFNYIYDHANICGDPFKDDHQWLPAYGNCSISCNPESAICLQNIRIDLQMCRELPDKCVSGIREFLGWSATSKTTPRPETPAWTTAIRTTRKLTTTVPPAIIIFSSTLRSAISQTNFSISQNFSSLGPNTSLQRKGTLLIRKIGSMEKDLDDRSQKHFDQEYPFSYLSTPPQPINNIYTPDNRLAYSNQQSENGFIEPAPAAQPPSQPIDQWPQEQVTYPPPSSQEQFVQSGDPYADILGVSSGSSPSPPPSGFRESDLTFYDDLENAYNHEMTDQRKVNPNMNPDQGLETLVSAASLENLPQAETMTFGIEGQNPEYTEKPYEDLSRPSNNGNIQVLVPTQQQYNIDEGGSFGDPMISEMITEDSDYPEISSYPGNLKHYDHPHKKIFALLSSRTIPTSTTTTPVSVSKPYRKTGRTLIYSIKRKIKGERNPLINVEPTIELLETRKNDRKYARVIVEQNLETKVDKFKHCCEWALAGMCDRHWQKVRRYCPRSCGLLVCEDIEGLQSCTRLLDVDPEECYSGLRHSREQQEIRGVKTYNSPIDQPRSPVTRYKRRRRKHKKRAQGTTTKRRKVKKHRKSRYQ